MRRKPLKALRKANPRDPPNHPMGMERLRYSLMYRIAVLEKAYAIRDHKQLRGKPMRELTETQVQEEAKHVATPISDLIGPKEVDSNATSWDEVDNELLRKEIHKSVDTILSEANYAHPKIASLIDEYARTLWFQDLSRAPMEHLAFDEYSEALSNGYWPYKADKWEVMEWIESQEEIPHYYRTEAIEVVSIGVHKGMEP